MVAPHQPATGGLNMNAARPLWTITCIVLLVLGIIGCGSRRDSNGKVDSQKANRSVEERQSPESTVLDNLVGTWGPSSNQFKAMTATWAVGATYLQIATHFNREDTVDTLTLLSCDKRKKLIAVGNLVGSIMDRPSGAKGLGMKSLTPSRLPVRQIPMVLDWFSPTRSAGIA